MAEPDYIEQVLRKTAGIRLRHGIWKAPVEFQVFDRMRRALGPVSSHI